MKKILVPTDFSKCASNATNFAAESARILPAEITLLHSIEMTDNSYSDYLGVNKEYKQSMLNDVKEKLSILKESVEKSGKVPVDTLVSTDALQEAITKASEEKKFDFIIMGTQGASGAEKLWGSTTAATIGKSTIPVLAIPDDYTWKKPQKILLMTNHFEKDPTILDFIFELTDLYMANIQVAVFTDEDDDKAGIFLEHRERISGYGEFLKNLYNEETLTSKHIYGENFEETLQKFIQEKQIDMLVMVTYQTKFWKRIFNPSKTKQMSYQTKIPLMAIPASMNSRK